MSVEIKCDDCSKHMESGDYTYCNKCYDELEIKLRDADERILELESLLSRCQENCNVCDNKLSCITNGQKT